MMLDCTILLFIIKLTFQQETIQLSSYPHSLFETTTATPIMNSTLSTSETSNYCSFFNNRAPSTQINLKNCTWYKENSCCLQREIESTFSQVKPLIGSSKLCQNYLNNLMCYICSPHQNKFYGKERLTVCIEFCDEIYSACAEAVLKGSKINEIYLNGIEFCKSRRFNVDYKKNDNCFHYNNINDEKNNTNNSLSFGTMILISIVIISIFHLN
jgi:hypothetical protein